MYAYIEPKRGISIQRGRENEADDPMAVGTCSFVLYNDDGRFSPGLSSSPYSPYVVQGVAVRVSAYVDGDWRKRFYGTVQNWSVQWLNNDGTEAITTVTCNDVLGVLPAYTFWEASAQAVRSSSIPPSYYWPRLSTVSSSFNYATVDDNGGSSADVGGMMLPLDEGQPHEVFSCASGGRRLTISFDMLSDVAVVDRPETSQSGACSPLQLGSISGNNNLSWTGSAFTFNGLSAAVPSTAVWPCVVSVRSWTSGGFNLSVVECVDSTGATSSAGASSDVSGLRKVIVNPTLSGGQTWSGGHLIVSGSPMSTWADALLAPRVPASGTAAAQLSTWAGGPTISGGTQGAATLPQLADRDSADALGALLIGLGARLIDNLDGTLSLCEFPPSGAVVALPAGEIDPAISWESSDIGWASVATVTWPDGTSYTATRPDGKRQSVAFEGVHATRSKDRSYADWLVWNTASTGSPRLQQAPYDLATLSDADALTICSLNVGTRVSLTGLPSQMPTTLLLIVEGLEETITDSEHLVTLKTSPDVYSRLFILDDPVQGVLDAGYLLAP